MRTDQAIDPTKLIKLSPGDCHRCAKLFNDRFMKALKEAGK